jgi:peptide chain release factor 2
MSRHGTAERLRSISRHADKRFSPFFGGGATGADAGWRTRITVSIGYNCTFLRSRRSTMEAERLNAIESLLADLRRRADELRGYL